MIRSLFVLLGCAVALAAQKTADEKRSAQAVTHSEAFLKLVNDAKTRVKEIDIEGYKKMVSSGDKHVLVDTREDSEWTAGHTAGAVHMSKGVIERDIEKQVPDKTTKLVLYCGGGFRSALAADNLQKMGYTNVISLDGGWRALQASGLPVEK
jgi:rhodanese-related sulfurtransferase